MTYTYYSYNCLILDLGADSALFFPASAMLRQPCKICPLHDFGFKKMSAFRNL